MKTKFCPKCKKEKPLNEFHKNKRTKNGINCYCKECLKSENIKDNEKLAKLGKKEC